MTLLRVGIVVGFLLLMTHIALGGELPPPTPRKDRPVADELWMRQVASEHNNLRIETNTPSGIRAKKAGDILLWNNSGSYKLCICVEMPSTWRCNANALTAP